MLKVTPRTMGNWKQKRGRKRGSGLTPYAVWRTCHASGFRRDSSAYSSPLFLSALACIFLCHSAPNPNPNLYRVLILEWSYSFLYVRTSLVHHWEGFNSRPCALNVPCPRPCSILQVWLCPVWILIILIWSFTQPLYPHKSDQRYDLRPHIKASKVRIGCCFVPSISSYRYRFGNLTLHCSMDVAVVTVSATPPLAFYQFDFCHLCCPAELAALQFLEQSHTAKWERREGEGLVGDRRRDQSCSGNWSGSGLLGCASSSLPVSPPPLPVGSNFSCVLLPSVPPLLRSPSFLSVSLVLSELTSLRGGPQTGPPWLEPCAPLSQTAISKAAHVVWNLTNIRTWI